MNTKGLLNQLLQSGPALLQNRPSPHTRGYRAGPGLGSPLSGLGGGLGKGALASGALGMLMGSRRMSSMGTLGRMGSMGGTGMSTGLKYGGLAALGMLAYHAYSDYQKQNAASAPQAPPRTVDRLTGDEAESHSHAILKALVAAAKADGHVDERERQLIDEELGKLADDATLRDWLRAELNKPLDPAEVASASKSPEMASEMYLVSLMMIDEQNYMERAYLDELARNLKLEPSLRASLEAQVARQD
jgi:uncharacterized membrane protein YebE (DUF533 family)